MPKAIAIFDYLVVPTNAIGNCHLQMLRQLAATYEFTVFAVRFTNPAPDRVKFVRIPAPQRPLALLFIAYHLMAPVIYMLHRLRSGARFDIVQSVESNYLFADVSYAHFCHRYYLKHHFGHWAVRDLRLLLRWLDHKLHACLEPRAFRRVRRIVVPSRGLARELSGQYAGSASAITVLSNPVDTQRMQRPAAFDRSRVRRQFGFTDSDLVLVFAALGQFERKGLPMLLEALAGGFRPELKVIVVGGEADLVRSYAHRCGRLGLLDRVKFAGMQPDVRPYLWSADAFVLPSAYEVFPLVVLEAAAAGLPVIVPRLNGVEEFLDDGRNSLMMDRSVPGVREALLRFLRLSEAQRNAMGERARTDVAAYGCDRFAQAWDDFYRCCDVA